MRRGPKCLTLGCQWSSNEPKLDYSGFPDVCQYSRWKNSVNTVLCDTVSVITVVETNADVVVITVETLTVEMVETVGRMARTRQS